MSGVFKLTPNDLGRDDGCEACEAGSKSGPMFLIEESGKLVDRVLCAACTTKEHPGLPLPIVTLAQTVSTINGAARRLLQEAPVPEQAPCPFPVVGSIFQEEAGQLFRVIEVGRRGDRVTLVLRDLDNPHHIQTKEVKE